MEQRRIGDRPVSALGYGAMYLSVQGRPPENQALATLAAVLAGGVTLIDTADAYCLDESDTGHNERLIARALRDNGTSTDQVLVATKGGHIRPHGDWDVDGRPDYLRRACEASLRALGVEAIDLYQYHRPDPTVPYEESVGAIADLQRAGKIRLVGLSNVSVAQLDTAQRLVEVVSVQNEFSHWKRRDEHNGVLRACARARSAASPTCRTRRSAAATAPRGWARSRPWPPSPRGTARRRIRSCWRGCWPSRPSWSPFPARRVPSAYATTSPRRASR